RREVRKGQGRSRYRNDATPLLEQPMCASLVFFTLTDNEKAVAVDRLITRHSACENVRMPSQSLFYLPFQRTYGKHVLHEITRERTLELLSPLLDDLAGSY
ncbi:unnamed protein product, partial [Ascophyllum nodosum]